MTTGIAEHTRSFRKNSGPINRNAISASAPITAHITSVAPQMLSNPPMVGQNQPVLIGDQSLDDTNGPPMLSDESMTEVPEQGIDTPATEPPPENRRKIVHARKLYWVKWKLSG